MVQGALGATLWQFNQMGAQFPDQQAVIGCSNPEDEAYLFFRKLSRRIVDKGLTIGEGIVVVGIPCVLAFLLFKFFALAKELFAEIVAMFSNAKKTTAPTS